MVKIQITKDYRITTDPHCWRVEKYRGVNKTTGEQAWGAFSYHSSLESLAGYLFDRMLREADATNMDELVAHGREIQSTIREALKWQK